jgi:hypothetical protein
MATSTTVLNLDDTTDNLERYGLGWLRALKGAALYHTDLAVRAIGRARYEQIISWMTEASVYPHWLVEILFDDFLAYKIARSKLNDVNESLVIAALPDFAQHLFLINTAENRAIDKLLKRGPIDHDTAGTTAPTGSLEEMEKTIGVFTKHGITFHPELWRDHVRFNGGAYLIPSGIVAPEAT